MCLALQIKTLLLRDCNSFFVGGRTCLKALERIAIIITVTPRGEGDTARELGANGQKDSGKLWHFQVIGKLGKLRTKRWRAFR